MVNVNSERGEVAITLGGNEYVLRPTFEAIEQLEAQTQGVAGILHDLARGKWKLSEIVRVICAGLQGSETPRMTPERVYQLVRKSPTAETGAAIGTFLHGALTAGVEEKNADAADGNSTRKRATRSAAA